ncbi:hypothetical protein ACFQVA_31970 [Actinomadura keratinilytica]
MLTGAVTGAVSATLLTGCSDGSAPGGTAAERARSAAAPRLLAAAQTGSERLLAQYDAVIAAHPPLAGRLKPLREQVAMHLSAFTSGPAEELPPNAAPPAPAPQVPPHAAAGPGGRAARPRRRGARPGGTARQGPAGGAGRTGPAACLGGGGRGGPRLSADGGKK